MEMRKGISPMGSKAFIAGGAEGVGHDSAWKWILVVDSDCME
jgi:hypothetical protein